MIVVGRYIGGKKENGMEYLYEDGRLGASYARYETVEAAKAHMKKFDLSIEGVLFVEVSDDWRPEDERILQS
jgi:hypothetical protein